MSQRYYTFELPPADEIDSTLQDCDNWVAAVLADLDRGEQFWIFAYGSLIWHPDIPVADQQPATAYGYHRDFCVYSRHYRGTPAAPGLVLGLDRGGSAHGLGLRVRRADAAAVAQYLWRREIVAHAYEPARLAVRTVSGSVIAHSFIADPAHEFYAGRLTFDEKVDLLRSASGYRGSNREYLSATIEQLASLGIRDRRLLAYQRAIAQLDAGCAG